MSFSIKSLLIAVVIVAVVAAVVGGVFRTVKDSYGTFEDFYAIWQTHMMLEDYLRDHRGEWPRAWDDLDPYFAKYKNLGWSEDIGALSRLVEIDFAFSPQEYFESAPPVQSAVPKLVSVTSYRNDIGWEELEAVNQRLMASLRKLHASD